MNRWFITGAAGFVGSNLSIYLLRHGYSVTGFDNLSTGSISNIQRVQCNCADGFKFIEGDIRDSSSVNRALKNVDVVIHLAAQVSVPKSLKDPEENYTINIEGFRNVLTESSERGVQQIVYASSCAVYGDNDNLPLDENDVTHPMSPYAESKLENERIAHQFSLDNPKIRIIGLRFFNIFGPWQNFEGGYASVIPRWLNSCLNNQQPDVFGDGNATRDYIFVDDVCSAIKLAALASSDVFHSVYNVGSGSQTSLFKLFDLVTEETKSIGKEVKFNAPRHLPARDGDIFHSCSDISQIENQLGFRPSVGLAEGIKIIRKIQYEN